MMRSVARLTLSGFLTLVAVGCAPRPPAPPTAIVVITLDTTRADRLTPYGFMSASMPFLDRLAREGVLFDQAISVAPLTVPAHASILTGLLPPSHGLRDNNATPLRPEHVTLAESLKDRGFHTAAFVGASVLARDRGLDQGFDRYDEISPASLAAGSHDRPAGAVIDAALEWLEHVDGRPFFLWVHLYDAHRPYAPPEPFASQYAHDPYLGEIAYTDSEIGRLLIALDRLPPARSLVVVAGDHGESLGEHGERDHGIFVYENVTRVPLIVRAPSIAPRRVGAVVSLTDIAPTTLALAGLPIPPMDGVSRVDVMRGGPTDEEAYSESHYPIQFGWSPLRALRDGRYKLIDAPRPELYDLANDPHEANNLYRERPALAGAMRRRLDQLTGQSDSRVAASAETDVDSGVRQRLAALGYVSRVRGSTNHNRPAPDPKDCIDLIEAQNPTRPSAHKRPTAGC